MLRGPSQAIVWTRKEIRVEINTQNIHIFLLQKSVGVRYLIILVSKRPFDVSAAFLAASVRS